MFRANERHELKHSTVKHGQRVARQANASNNPASKLQVLVDKYITYVIYTKKNAKNKREHSVNS